MKYLNLIRSDLFIKNNVGTMDQRHSLLSEISLNMSLEKGLPNTNDGCWRSSFRYNTAEWLYQELYALLDQSVKFYLEHHPSYRNALSPQGLQVDQWTNVNNPGSINRLHTHSTYDFVGLYYIQATGTGELTFHNPANLMQECNVNSPSVSRMSYTPIDGDLVLWPAWMPHEVELNKSDKQRINIAFNIKL